MDSLICKSCDKEFKGIMHHLVFCGCWNHLKFWRLFSQAKEDYDE